MFIEGASRQPESSTGSGGDALPKSTIAQGVSEVISHEMPVLDTSTGIRSTVDELFYEADKNVHAIMHRICNEGK